MATLIENYRRAAAYQKRKARQCLSDALSQTWHPQDFADYERYAEGQQMAEYRLSGQENLESGRAWQT